MNKPRARIRETMGWRVEVEARIAELEHYRLLLEEARSSARSIGGPEVFCFAGVRRCSSGVLVEYRCLRSCVLELAVYDERGGVLLR